MSEHDDFAFEPVAGLPALPPKGERILWQGQPLALRLAIEAYGLNWIMGYFAVVVIWRASVGSIDGGLAGAFAYGIPYVILAVLAAIVVLGLAWVQARATVYTVTTSRVAMRIGAALTVTLNLPYTQIGTARLDLRRGGSGTIALETLGDSQLSYLVCWPHVRPWHMKKTEPALRCIPDAERVARLLSEAAESRLAQPVVARSAHAATAARPQAPAPAGMPAAVPAE